MKKRIPLAVYIVSGVLLLYAMLVVLNAPPNSAWFLFILSPFLMIWMVVSVLKIPGDVAELNDEEEWGYEDRDKKSLGMF